jgi:hypothetical protein
MDTMSGAIFGALIVSIFLCVGNRAHGDEPGAPEEYPRFQASFEVIDWGGLKAKVHIKEQGFRTPPSKETIKKSINDLLRQKYEESKEWNKSNNEMVTAGVVFQGRAELMKSPDLNSLEIIPTPEHPIMWLMANHEAPLEKICAKRKIYEFPPFDFTPVEYCSEEDKATFSKSVTFDEFNGSPLFRNHCSELIAKVRGLARLSKSKKLTLGSAIFDGEIYHFHPSGFWKRTCVKDESGTINSINVNVYALADFYGIVDLKNKLSVGTLDQQITTKMKSPKEKTFSIYGIQGTKLHEIKISARFYPNVYLLDELAELKRERASAR